MLVLFSDIHLTDESTARNVPDTAFELLGETIATYAGKKRAKEVHVVLLGDTFDLVRTDYWFSHKGLKDEDLPWNGKLDESSAINRAGKQPFQKVEESLQAILARILLREGPKGFVTMVKDLAKSGPPLKLTFVVGNHDRMLNNFPSLQSAIIGAFQPFKEVSFCQEVHFPGSSGYGAIGRHGHEWDEHCHGFELYRRVLAKGSNVGRFDPVVYQVQTIGEVITAELLSGFLFRMRVALEKDGRPHHPLLEELKDINNLRPLSAVFSWIAWVSQQPLAARHLEAIRHALRDSVERVLDSALARMWDKVRADLIVSGDLTDYLGKLLIVLKQKNGLELLGQLLPYVDTYQSMQRLVAGGEGVDQLSKGAEYELTDGRGAGDDVQFLFYGHSHDARSLCLRAHPSGRVKMYVNTGTFLPFIERARRGSGFYSSGRMTYACVYLEGEGRDPKRTPGPALDVWNGLRQAPPTTNLQSKGLRGGH